MNPSELILSYKVEPPKGNEKQFELGGLRTYSATYLSAKQNHGVFQVISDVCMYVCKSLFKHGKSSVKLKLKTKTNYNCFT